MPQIVQDLLPVFLIFSVIGLIVAIKVIPPKIREKKQIKRGKEAIEAYAARVMERCSETPVETLDFFKKFVEYDFVARHIYLMHQWLVQSIQKADRQSDQKAVRVTYSSQISHDMYREEGMQDLPMGILLAIAPLMGEIVSEMTKASTQIRRTGDKNISIKCDVHFLAVSGYSIGWSYSADNGCYSSNLKEW